MGLFSFIGNKYKNFTEAVEDFVKGSNLPPEQKKLALSKLDLLANRQVNILIVGGTGAGKSSTINALFQNGDEQQRQVTKAIVGTGPNPETQSISHYALDNLIIWDSPGLGESTTADIIHSRAINQKLRETTEDGEFLIDLVLIVLDGGSRDYDSTFRLLKVIGQQIKDQERILIAINKIDMVEKGHGWDDKSNCPSELLKLSIEKKINSVKRRISQECNLVTEPVAYCAGYEDLWVKRESYQVNELLTQIISAIPCDKRVAVLNKVKPEVLKKTSLKQKEVIHRKTEESFLGKGLLKIGLGLLTGGLLGGCFITTAVCRSNNKSDDCHMLNTFRKFRDGWLIDQPDGQVLISEYYEIAPKIVNWIDGQENSKSIYADIERRYLRPCYRFIKHKEFYRTKLTYTKMVRELQQSMLKNYQ